MFGGAGLYLDGVMFGLVHGDALHFRVDDATRPRYESAGCAPFEPRPGVKSLTWLSVPEDVLEDPDALVAWAREAVRAAGGG